MSKKIIKKSACHSREGGNPYKKRILKFIVDSAVRSLAVFLILGMTVVAYAYVTDGITWPDQGPGKVTGVVGMFVGLSDEGYTTSVTDYSSLNTQCNSYTDPVSGEKKANNGAHVCTAMEITNSYNVGSLVIAAQTSGVGIINNGPPGYTVFANDCNGWTLKKHVHNGTEVLGAVWQFAKKTSSLASCGSMEDYGGISANTNVSVACCK